MGWCGITCGGLGTEIEALDPETHHRGGDWVLSSNLPILISCPLAVEVLDFAIRHYIVGGSRACVGVLTHPLPTATTYNVFTVDISVLLKSAEFFCLNLQPLLITILRVLRLLHRYGFSPHDPRIVNQEISELSHISDTQLSS